MAESTPPITESARCENVKCDDGNNQPKLTASQRARIERNRQRALLLKQSRIVKRSLTADSEQATQSFIPTKVLDTGGGFLIEEDEDDASSSKNDVVHPKGALLVADILVCDDCDQAFTESYLFNNFEAVVCDKCKDMEDAHKLITKTEAKATYLLKDADLEMRDPPLKFIEKKNPRKSSWGTMKLYLETQVAARAEQVWGSDEKLEEEQLRRAENKEQAKRKKFDKRIKDLRKEVRSSLFKKDMSVHEHIYGTETYNGDEDTYTKVCTECGQSLTYEKM